jgi:1-acyl-sn-glycerol-3-phosphate acyltransferase
VGFLRDAEALVTRSIAQQGRQVGRIVMFGALTAGMLPGLLLHEGITKGERQDEVRRRWVAVWAAALLRVFGVRAVVRGDANTGGPPARGRLVVANHRSTADVLLLLHTFGGRMVSRADLAGWPLVGAAARAVGTLFVDRANASSGAVLVRTLRSRLTAGDTVIVFPEGTTFPDDDVRPFHAGAFVAAARTDAIVVPVGLAYESGSGAAFVGETFPAHLARMAAASPSRVALCVGPSLAARTSRSSELRDAARVEVQRLVHEARAIVDCRSPSRGDAQPR